ncbi:MAG: DUF4440 domain-containing protein [Chloroflexota bacterium]
MTLAQSDIASAVRELNEKMMKNARAKDANRLVEEFYAADARVLAPNMPAVSGKASIVAVFQGMLDAGLTDIVLSTTHVESSGDLAYEVGTYRLKLEPAGADPIQDNGKYVVVLGRQSDGSWKCVADIFNTDLPAA